MTPYDYLCKGCTWGGYTPTDAMRHADSTQHRTYSVEFLIEAQRPPGVATNVSSAEPEWRYDRAVDCGYLRLSNEEVTRTKTSEYVNVDLDALGNVVGVEVIL